MYRLLPLVLLLGSALPLFAQQKPSREEKVRADKAKVEAAGFWRYNDLPGAFAEAKTSGKPVVVVLRCLPCEECVKLDDELIDADDRLHKLLEQFVRVRVVGTNGLDLATFQFDTDQSFAVFLLNTDGTIYGRFGTRSHRTDWLGDVSVEGMAAALEGALALHREYPANKAALAAKRGPAPAFSSPEQYPSLKEEYTSKLDYEGKVVQSCVHCHMIGDAQRDLALKSGEKFPEQLLFPYPHPKSVGLVLDPKAMATVLSVTAGSAAEKSGFKPGDKIQTLAGQPLISMADVQWVLHHASSSGVQVKAEVVRDSKPLTLWLELAPGWRRSDDISWRSSTWQLRRAALGGMFLATPNDDERAKLKVPESGLALIVRHVGQFPPHDVAFKAGVRKDDILLSFAGHNDLLRETDLIAYSLDNLKPGDKIDLILLRGGAKQNVSFTLPK